MYAAVAFLGEIGGAQETRGSEFLLLFIFMPLMNGVYYLYYCHPFNVFVRRFMLLIFYSNATLGFVV